MAMIRMERYRSRKRSKLYRFFDLLGTLILFGAFFFTGLALLYLVILGAQALGID
jgi:hypothetical protein